MKPIFEFHVNYKYIMLENINACFHFILYERWNIEENKQTNVNGLTSTGRVPISEQDLQVKTLIYFNIMHLYYYWCRYCNIHLP